MKQYKIGNKVTAMIRNFNNPKIGSIDMEYIGQPYTILKDIEADIYFEDNDKTAKQKFNLWNYSDRKVNRIVLKDVPLTSRICNLIFKEQAEGKIMNITNIEDTELYFLPSSAEKVYNLYIFDENQKIAYQHDEQLVNNGIRLNKNNQYLVCYDELVTSGYSLENTNLFLGLDLLFTGNQEDFITKYMMRFTKTALKINSNYMQFDNTSNTIELEFMVLEDGENTISIQE